ncbi:MAG: DHA2 family efflux MFS transporter permease subunit [Actinomycetota bacterium]|nr:DHA2 family efflux MFS transporter permease subunit [Actinomycetota bacterium]
MRRWRGNPWAILVTLSLGFFMTLLDLTIVNIAIPNMISALDASLDEILWVVNSYVLVLAVLLITAGRLGDLRGQRTLFAVGVAVFTVASFACGVAPSATLLIAFRAVQGLGAALLMPQTMALVIATFPAQRRGTALGVWGGVAGLATVAGPTVGGLLVTAASWRWIFIVNVPIGVLVLVMTFAIIPDTRMEREHRLDIPGVLIATAGLFCLTFALIEGQRYSWGAGILLLFVASAALLVLFLLQQRGRQDREPLVPFSLFRDRNFAVINAIAALVSVGILGFYLPLTIYLQSVLGFSALKAGLILAPSSILAMVLSPISGRMSDVIGGKYILMTGLTAFGLGATLLTLQTHVGSSWPAFLPGILLLGIGFGGIFAPMATEAMRSVPANLAGAASGVNNTVRQVGSVVGSAAVGAVLQSRLASTLREEAVSRSAQLPSDVRPGFVAGFAKSAKGGVDVGSSQQATAHAGLPAAVAAQVQKVGSDVFQNAYVRAMHPTLVLPIAAMCLAAALCLLAQRHPSGAVASRADSSIGQPRLDS